MKPYTVTKTGSFDDDQQKQLVLRVQQGDRQAFDGLMARYHRQVFNIAYRIFGDYYQADEIAQEVFFRVFKSIKSFKFQSKFMSWLYRITVNLCRDQLKTRQNKAARHISLDEPVIGPEGESIQREIPDSSMAADKALIDNELSDIIQCGLNALDAEHREIIILRDIEQLAYGEIAEILGINIGTVKSRLHRARNMLSGRLEEVI